MSGGYAIAFLPFFLAGCGTYTPREVADPTSITLRDALIDVADSLEAMRQQTRPRDKFGLIPDEVTVTFNIQAHGTNTGHASLNVNGSPIPGTTLGGTIENTLVSDSNRGNQIVVKLKNLATADLSKGDRRLVDACFKQGSKDCAIIAVKPIKPAKE